MRGAAGDDADSVCGDVARAGREPARVAEHVGGAVRTADADAPARRGPRRDTTSSVSPMPGEDGRADDRLVRHPVQPGGEREQVAGEVSAVDGRDVQRPQRLQRPRVVPVEQVAAVPLQPVDAPSVRAVRPITSPAVM